MLTMEPCPTLTTLHEAGKKSSRLNWRPLEGIRCPPGAVKQVLHLPKYFFGYDWLMIALIGNSFKLHLSNIQFIFKDIPY